MSYGCTKCKQPIHALEEKVQCDCCRTNKYHLRCTSMNVYNLRHCREDEHVFWICETCLPGVRESLTGVANTRKNIEKPKEDLSDNAEDSLEFAVSHLQTEFAEIKKCVNDLKQSFSSPPAPVSGESTARLPTSTPKIHTSFTMPSNPTDRVKLSVGSSERYASPNEGRKFWIFFTKVAKHVSCEEISAMVTKHLNLSDPPDVVRLVPHWINDAELRYVSFKVGVCWRYKEVAVSESTWPTGLMFREFIQSETYYWEP